MVNVIISSLPKEVKLPKFTNFLKKVIFRCKKDLHINYMRQISDRLGQISISTKYKEALKAKRILDGYQYIFGNVQYTLECWLENLEEDQIDVHPGQYHENDWTANDKREERTTEMMDYNSPRQSRRYPISPTRLRSRSRSRSSFRSNHLDEIKTIEMKIELIRKQRILLEEETKLLIEKRKLEFLQNFSSKDSGKLAIFEEVCRRNDVSEISGFLATPEPLQVAKPKVTSKLPSYIGPCKEITAQMKKIVRAHDEINVANAPIFWNLLRASVKKRLAIILEGKAYMPTKSIVGLYRAKHPVITDRSFVDEILNTVQTSFWPEKPRKAESTTVATQSQTAKAEKPTADIPEVVLTGPEEYKNCVPEDEGKFATDEYIDMENDFENWVEDDEIVTGNIDDNVGESFDTGEPTTIANDTTESNVTEENREVPTNTETAFEEVDEVTLIVDDADKFNDTAEGTGEGVELPTTNNDTEEQCV